MKGVEDIEGIVLRREADSTPILVRDVATVAVAPLTRQGAVTRDGRGEVVIGMVMMLYGENSRQVVQRAKARLEEIERTLPEGVKLEVVYDRSSLIGRTLKTVLTNLTEGGLLVIVVLLAMLGSVRAGLLVTLAIPLSMLFAANLMAATGVTASLMSLGAIDFGLIVDSSVIMVENCVRRLAHPSDGRSRLEIIRDAAVEVRKPTIFGELIIAIVYIPILALQGTEGKLFKPMALTVLFALCGSLILSMTFMPALATLMLPRNLREGDVWLVRRVKQRYEPLVRRHLARPLFTVGVAVVVFAISIPVAWTLGADFMPHLQEGDLLIEAYRLPTATLEDSTAMTTQVEKELLKFPEVRTVFCKTGRPEIANDMMGVEETDIWVMLKPRDQWPAVRSADELGEEMAKVLLERVPGANFAPTQPIEMRVHELVAGVKADVAVLLYGDDLTFWPIGPRRFKQVLAQHSRQRRRQNEFSGQSFHGADRAESGGAGPIRHRCLPGHGRRRVAWRTPRRAGLRGSCPVSDSRSDSRAVANESVAIGTASGGPGGREAGPAATVGRTSSSRRRHRPSNTSRVGAARSSPPTFAVATSSVLSARPKQAIRRRVPLPPNYEVRWGGDFQNLQSASLRLAMITPIVL